jgi:hypothetical protein
MYSWHCHMQVDIKAGILYIISNSFLFGPFYKIYC